jgi:hypothetical protein
MTTARDLIKSALRKCGALTKYDVATADEMSDALQSLNDLLGSMANHALLAYYRTVEDFPIVSGQTDYTIGDGGDFDTVRPINIASAYIRQSTIDHDVYPVSDSIYASISSKNTGGIPRYLNYTNATPLSTIKLYPAPATGYTLFLVSEKQVSTLTLNTTLNFPAGWNRYLVNQLAIELAPEYGAQIPQETYLAATQALDSITTAAAKVKDMDALPRLGNDSNIYTGYNS